MRSRSFKYLYLFLGLALTIKIVFDGFSYYLARRSLDAELETKGRKSLEYLVALASRERALSISSLETRCRERNQLAVYNITNAALSNFPQLARDAYAQAFAVKKELATFLQRNGRGIIDIDESIDAIWHAEFSPMSMDTLKKALVLPAQTKGKPEASPTNSGAAPKTVDELVKAASPILAKFSSLFENNSEILSKIPLGAALADVSSIKVLEERASRLKAEHQKNVAEFREFDELVSKYSAWTEALAGSGDRFPLQEMYYELTQDQASKLDSLNCENLKASYTIITGRPFEPFKPNDNARAGSDVFFDAIGDFYRSRLVSYFGIPPVAQTLFVTLFLGALGAFTLNVLRLSKVGWWGSQADPDWGELWVCPFLGALAAFGIFLLGTTGLLLTNDVRSAQSGGTSLSAFFIGLLGFMSGLLYDEAFGKVRRFGSQFFASGTDAGVNPDDRALADFLGQSGASLAGELALTYGLGARLKAESEFTLLVPTDDAFDTIPLKAWRDISSPASRPQFDVWFAHHHAPKKFDEAALITAAAIQVDNGGVLKVTTGPTSVEGSEITKADLPWGNGVIHIIKKEL